MRAFLVAAQFLTVLPFPGPAEPRPADYGRAVACFPLVGLLVGALCAGTYAAARALWPASVAVALVPLVSLLVTGALHFDGLLDTCDGIFLWKPERRLEVMRDSRVGGFGVAGGVSVYALKLLTLLALAGLPVPATCAAIALAPVLGRAAIACAVVGFPYARAQGLGNAFKANARSTHAVAAAATAAAVAAPLLTPGAVLFAAAAAAAALLAPWVRRRLGGLTGDTYGFICELVETAVYLAAAALPLRPAWAAWAAWAAGMAGLSR